jgi:ketosteroid isomerase-like protein
METVTRSNTQIAQALYGYFGEGNVPAILDLLTDDIKWTCPGPKEILPYTDQQRLKYFFRQLSQVQTEKTFLPQKLKSFFKTHFYPKTK